MKKTLLLAVGILLSAGLYAQKTVELDAPDKERPTTLMKALSDRKSERVYAERELTKKDLSDLLWAANGFNRPEKRTAATAMNQQEIDVYVCMKDGAYLYNAKEHKLELVIDEDLRPLVAGSQAFAAKAPVCLVIVADLGRVTRNQQGMRRMSAYDAGIVSQNIYLFCSAYGLATVCRAGMDKENLAAKLKLGSDHILHLNHPVGYPK